MSLRIVFMGTPEFAAPTLNRIVENGHEVVACYTREPKPAGRGMAMQRSPVQRLAATLGIPVFSPRTLRNDDAAVLFAAHAANVAVVVAYGLILPKVILDAPRSGCLNLHGSLLPRWRGAAPLQRALMAGDAETGVTVMRMEEGLDSGPVGVLDGQDLIARIAIPPEMTAGELHDRMAPHGAALMARALAGIEAGALGFRPQAEAGVTWAPKIGKGEAAIDWTRPAREVHNHIRGLSPFPGAFFTADWGAGPVRVKALRSTVADGDGEPGTVLDDALTVACGAGAIRVLEGQRPGKAAMPAAELLRGAPIRARLRLG